MKQEINYSIELEFCLKEYIVIQVKEIQEHKYFLSEKQGRDVGLEAAISDWVENGHAKRFHDNFFAHKQEIENYCQSCCVSLDNCSGEEYSCPLTLDKVHELLKDMKN